MWLSPSRRGRYPVSSTINFNVCDSECARLVRSNGTRLRCIRVHHEAQRKPCAYGIVAEACHVVCLHCIQQVETPLVSLELKDVWGHKRPHIPLHPVNSEE